MPSVGDAPARVHRILAAHHGRYAPAPAPARLADAVVAVEDEHFYDNVFVNVLDGAGRAAVAALHTNADPGGSTIAQQLAKQLYGRGSGFDSTLREIALGVKLSLSYSKSEVLNMYLNAVYFGHGYWGELAASEGYFATTPGRLSWAQATLLAGLPQSPSRYDPLEHLGLARARQRHVLDQLVDNHYLTRQQADAAYRAPLHLR
jgi:penicillin-binding protein 1A